MSHLCLGVRVVSYLCFRLGDGGDSKVILGLQNHKPQVVSVKR